MSHQGGRHRRGALHPHRGSHRAAPAGARHHHQVQVQRRHHHKSLLNFETDTFGKLLLRLSHFEKLYLSSSISHYLLYPPCCSVEAVEGQPYTLTCSSRGGSPAPDITWTRGLSEVPLRANTTRAADRDAATVSVLEITPRKEDDGVEFRCGVSSRGWFGFCHRNCARLASARLQWSRRAARPARSDMVAQE